MAITHRIRTRWSIAIVARNVTSVAGAPVIVVVLDTDVNTLLGYSYGVRRLTSVSSFVVGRD